MKDIRRLSWLTPFLSILVIVSGCGPAAGDKEAPAAEAAKEEAAAEEGAEESPARPSEEAAEETPAPAGETAAEETTAEETAAPEFVPSLEEWRQALLSDPVSLDQVPVSVTVTAPNSNTEGAMSFSFVWQFPESAWKVEPKDAALEVQPGEQKEVSFTLSPATPAFPFPVPQLSATVTSEGTEILSVTKPLTPNYIRAARLCPAAEPPSIDGNIEPAWESGTRISGFLLEDGSYLANPPTVVYALYDNKNLYFAFICYEADTGALKLDARKRDDPVWQDDSVEVFITAPDDPDTYYHFLLSAAGVMQDEIADGKNWNGRWKAAAFIDREGKKWTAEISIPASDIGVRSLSKIPQLRVNFTRNRYAGKKQFSMWNCTFGSSHRPELFGRLLLK